MIDAKRTEIRIVSFLGSARKKIAAAQRNSDKLVLSNSTPFLRRIKSRINSVLCWTNCVTVVVEECIYWRPAIK